ncbi:MAG TPA: DUF4331 domain-containing protein [Solirubrobacteraceae bacterium]|jgi:hypothetical protein|nr:DUF4331 domain-containing protein [Solirubrobacteraceae bacterium]
MRISRRLTGVRFLALLAALAAGTIAVSLSFGSSHREAPGTMLDPSADDTDVYAFVANDAPNSLTLVGNWIPFEDPAGGPNFYRFDDRASYYLNVDNTGDGRYDVRYKFKFRTVYRNKNSGIYALPGVSGISDPKLQVIQRYDVTREVYRPNGKLRSAKVIARNLPVGPNNTGSKNFPNYDAVGNQAIRSLPGGGKVFVGQRDDPFFVDLGATFDSVHLRKGTGNVGGGKDDLAGYNVHSIVLQVPKSKVTRNGRSVSGPKAANAVVGVWASTYRPALQVNGLNSVTGQAARKSRRASSVPEVQVSRLGNPLINELVIPIGLKDKFNATQPANDAANFGAFVVKPELAKVLNILFPGLNVPETNRTDIVQALLTGIPGVTQIGKNPAAADTLKVNLGVPPTTTPNRFGVIGGDNAGFPNGRRLGDDVVDISLRVVGGFLKGNKLPLGDGVDANDVPYLSAFPYVPSPHAGFDSALKRNEPDHAATPGDLNPPTP